MGLASKYMTEVAGIFEKMAEVKVDDDQLMSFIQTLFVNEDYVQKKGEASTRAKNLVNTVFSFAKHHPTQNTSATAGTLYGAYNSVSGYFGHVKNYKSASQRMESISFGYGASKTNRAFARAKSAMEDISVLEKKAISLN